MLAEIATLPRNYDSKYAKGLVSVSTFFHARVGICFKTKTYVNNGI